MASRRLPTTGSYSPEPKSLARQVGELEQRMKAPMARADSDLSSLEKRVAALEAGLAELEARVAALEP